MMRKLFFVVLLLSAHFAFAVDDNIKRFTADNTDLNLSIKLLQQTIGRQKSNIVVSPLSVYVASSLLANGAVGESLQELQTNILGSTKGSSLQNINDHLDNYWQNLSKSVKMCNSVWGDDFLTDYVNKVSQKLHSEALPRPQNTDVINQWVREKTNGLISNVLDSDAIENFAIYLVNAVYFEDDWVHQFSPEVTREKNFYSLDADTPDKVSLMYSKRNVDYFENDVMQAIRLPYKSGDVMQIFLPKKEVNFMDFVKGLKIEDLTPFYKKQVVEIYLPRFEINYKIGNMKDIFKNLGVIAVFSKEVADLSALSFSPHYVEDIFHQVNIRLDEKGTVAVAVTSVIVRDVGGELLVKRPIFRADRPFVFMINNGVFVGAYMYGSVLKAALNVDKCYVKADAEDFVKDYDCLLKQATDLEITDFKECLIKNREKYDLLKNTPKKVCHRGEVWGFITRPFDEKGLQECLFYLENPDVDKSTLVYDSNDYIVGKIKKAGEGTRLITLGFDSTKENIGVIKDNRIVNLSDEYSGKIDENGKVIIDKVCDVYE